MGMSRCYSLVKGVLIVFSIIFLCVGAGACGFSCWALWETHARESAAGRAGLLALAAWGAALALAALLALAGSCRGSAALLAAAFALLALTGVAEAAAAWWGAAHLPALRGALRDTLRHALRHDYGELPARTDLIDVIQAQLRCCGVDGARDWQAAAWSRRQAALEGAPDAGPSAPLDLSVGAPAAYYYVPKSCCVTEDATACEAARRVPAAGGAGGGAGGGGGGEGALAGAACGERVLAALAAGARGPLLAAGALAALHAAALLAALALCLRAPHHAAAAHKA